MMKALKNLWGMALPRGGGIKNSREMWLGF